MATLLGLSAPLAASHSANALLRPDNAIRIAKSLVETLILLPFMVRRQRLHRDLPTWLGYGVAAGLIAVTLIVISERILFASVLDVRTDYRVAGPFSSMRVGGGHIGAYAALALPFSLSLLQLRSKWLGIVVAVLGCICGGYTLAVTFARTAYAAAAIAMTVAGLGWLWSANPRRTRPPTAAIVPSILVLSILSATVAFTGMYARFAASTTDFLIRQDNWRAGLMVRDRGFPATLFGMGLGTYQRTMLLRSLVNRPTDLMLNQDSDGTYVSMQVETPFFLGQKITLPDTGSLHLTLRARAADDRTNLGVLLCDKVLLYSDHCRGIDIALHDPNQWINIETIIPTNDLGRRALSGLLRRPVELALFGPVGHRIDIRDITLTNDTGQPELVNGDFTHSLDRWIFTDDSHVAWRMLNQYLMLFFETGIIGLAAFIALAGLAFAGGIRAVQRGHPIGAPVAGAIAGFMVSGLFDNVLEAPRLATLFFVICCCGLIQWQSKD